MLRYSCHLPIVGVCLFALTTFSASAQVLGYSTYLGNNNTQGASFGVNGTGDACVFAGPNLLKLDSTGAIIYSVSVQSASVNVGNGAMTIDSQGDCYLVSIGTITPTPGAFQSAPKASTSGQVVVKFDGTGKMVYGTYLGGSGQDFPFGIAVDSDGNTYITGFTTSNDFPTIHAFQSALGGGEDAFVAVLNSTGTELIYSTYLGGTKDEVGSAIAVDGAKNAYVTGTTSSNNFPTVSPLQSALAGTTNNAFVSKLNPSGTPIYSTYLGGSDSQGAVGSAIAADADGNAYVSGTAETGFPLVNPIQSTGIYSAFVSKLNAGGSALTYSTLLGDFAYPKGIAVDSARRAYVSGGVIVGANTTPQGSIPLASPIQNSFGTRTDIGFVSVLNSAGTSLVFSTYLGGDGGSVAGFGLDSAGNIYVAGTAVGPFPILNAPDGVYLPLVPVKVGNPSPAQQGFVQKISLIAGTSLSHPTTVDFRPDSLPVGNSATAPVLLANTSAVGDIAISNIVITGDYSQTNNCGSTLLAATSCQFQITFTPTAEGDRSGSITITDTAPGSLHVIGLIGTGLLAHASLSPNPLIFTSQSIGTTSASQIVTLTNSGGALLSISSIVTTGDFSESNNCGSLLATGKCQISVLFSPTALGNRTGLLSVTDSASGSPHTVNLSGTGAAPSLGLGVPPGGTATATVVAGASATYTLSVGGGGVSTMVSLSCTGAPKGANCAVPATQNVGAATPTTFTVTVTTTSRTQGRLQPPGTLPSSGLWAMVLMVVVLSVGAGKQSIGRKIRFLPLALILPICACGGGAGGGNTSVNPNGTPAGTYSLTINAASASNTQSTTLTLVVQ